MFCQSRSSKYTNKCWGGRKCTVTHTHPAIFFGGGEAKTLAPKYSHTVSSEVQCKPWRLLWCYASRRPAGRTPWFPAGCRSSRRLLTLLPPGEPAEKRRRRSEAALSFRCAQDERDFWHLWKQKVRSDNQQTKQTTCSWLYAILNNWIHETWYIYLSLLAFESNILNY